jgi:acyl-CoA thioesterase
MESDDPAQFPLRNFLGMEIEEVEAGHAVARVEVTADFLNPNGVVHGGVLFTMVDTAMGKATLSVIDAGQRCASVEVQLRFLRPVVAGHLEAVARVIQAGRKIIHLEAQIRDGQGTLVATGTGTFVVIATTPA